MLGIQFAFFDELEILRAIELEDQREPKPEIR